MKEQGQPSGPRRRGDLGIRILWIAILVTALALVFQVGRALTDRSSPVIAEPQSGELSVAQAITRYSERPVAVRGYIFKRERFPPELCTGRLPGRPPRCMGPTITLNGLDLARLDLRRGDDNGVEVLWTDESVAVLGDLSTATMTVREILA